MDTHERLRQLLNERGWTEYRLAKNCGLSESTIANIYRRNTVPSLATLEAICKGFWVNLTPEQKKAANQMLKAMNNDK